MDVFHFIFYMFITSICKHILHAKALFKTSLSTHDFQFNSGINLWVSFCLFVSQVEVMRRIFFRWFFEWNFIEKLLLFSQIFSCISECLFNRIYRYLFHGHKDWILWSIVLVKRKIIATVFIRKLRCRQRWVKSKYVVLVPEKLHKYYFL